MGKLKRVMGRWLSGLQIVAVALAVVAALALGYLAMTRETAVDNLAADPAGDATTSTSPSPSESSAPPSDLPRIPDQRRVDFLKGDDLPDGASLVDLVDGQSGLELTKVGLVHGPPAEAGGAGFLETRLKSDVHKLGVRVTFARDSPGAVVLAAWESSVADAPDPSNVPRTGLRLNVTPGAWELVVHSDVDETIAEGFYNSLVGETVSIEVLRQGDLVFVIDPAGKITEIAYPQVSRFAGPWASWGLVESSAQQPAVIESVWAG